ncbi:MAG: hypothetical protein ACP5H8_03080 [Candidatus Micrarchaeia archaeon]
MGIFSKWFGGKKKENREEIQEIIRQKENAEKKRQFNKAKEENKIEKSFREIIPLQTVFKSSSIMHEIKCNSEVKKIIIANENELPKEFGMLLPTLDGNYIISAYRISKVEVSTEVRRNNVDSEVLNKLILEYNEHIPFYMFGEKELEVLNKIIEWAKVNRNIELQLPPTSNLEKNALSEILDSAEILYMSDSLSRNFTLNKLIALTKNVKKISNNKMVLNVENASAKIRINYILIDIGSRKLARKNDPFTVAELYDVDPAFIDMDPRRLQNMVYESIVIMKRDGNVAVLIPYSKSKI